MIPMFKHEGVKSITVHGHISNFTNQLLSLPSWQRRGQKIWQGDYKSELIDSIMSGVMLPMICLAEIKGILQQMETIIIDGGHRTRTLHAYKNNEFAWKYKDELVYYSETHHDTRGNRIMTAEERHMFDNYHLTFVTYHDIDESGARMIFNRLQNAAPMTMADIVNSYESPLVDYFRFNIRSKLLRGADIYDKVWKRLGFKKPDTNEDLYQMLSLFSIVNPSSEDESMERNALKCVEMGKDRENNACFRYLRNFDNRILTPSMIQRFESSLENIYAFASKNDTHFKSGGKGDIPTYLHSLLYVELFSKSRFSQLLDDVDQYKHYDSSSEKLFKAGKTGMAESMKVQREALNHKYEGALEKWVKTRANNPANESNMIKRRDIVKRWCIGEDAVAEYVEGQAIEVVS